MPSSSISKQPRDILSITDRIVAIRSDEDEDKHSIRERYNDRITAIITADDINEEWRNQSTNDNETTIVMWTNDTSLRRKCAEPSPDLKGRISQAVLLIQNLKESDVLHRYPYLMSGGHWKPKHCISRHKIAIIVPYRDRQSHLTRLIDFLVPMLKRQLLDFRFIVTEQYGNDLFNKGRIMNAAFTVAEQLGVDCVIFHDVDMFPQNDRNSYGCPKSPRHIGAFVSNLGYQLWYDYIVGGVLAISIDHYRAVNGYSNMYWAWGGEDDDMGKRIIAHNFTIERPDPANGRFTMLKHVKRKRTAPKLIYKLLDMAETRWPHDGLNEADKWKIVKISRRPLYYHMFVDVGTPPDAWKHDGDLPELNKSS